MKSTAIFGRFSGGYLLLAAVLLASALGVGLALAVLLTHAKPAQAAGETWYGTMDFQGTGKPVATSEGGTYTDKSFHRFEAPFSSDQARVYSKVDTTVVSPKPEFGCGVVERKFYGSGWLTGKFYVGDPAGSDDPYGRPQGFYTMSAYSDYYQGSGSSIPVNEAVTYAGTNPDGSDCARTETNPTSFAPFGDIQSYQTPNPNYRSGTSVTPSLNWIGSCANYEDGYRECADMQSFHMRGEVRARWSVARNVCSGYSRRWDIGKDDTLVLFNTCQTKSLSARTSFLDELTGRPKVCDVNFVKRLSQACTAYKAVLRTQWAQNDWFLYTAAISDNCGLWVVDDAPWRPPKIRPATDADTLLDISSISPGRTQNVKTATGSMPVTC